jgi:hypothetical protein
MKKIDFLEKYKGEKFEANGFRVCDSHVEVYFYADHVWVHCLFIKKEYNIHAFESTENIVRDFQQILFVNDKRKRSIL